jgi:plastocyanin
MAAALVATTLIGCTADQGSARDLVLVARGMEFVVADDANTSNPTLRLRAGERVRVVLRNEAPGLLHDFAIPAWDVQIPTLRAGESGDVTFTVPSTPGRFEYRCRPHSEMMTGSIEVTR